MNTWISVSYTHLDVYKRQPRTEVHISTQAGIVNYQSARAFYDLGASRVVLARELSLELSLIPISAQPAPVSEEEKPSPRRYNVAVKPMSADTYTASDRIAPPAVKEAVAQEDGGAETPYAEKGERCV